MAWGLFGDGFEIRKLESKLWMPFETELQTKVTKSQTKVTSRNHS